MKNLTADNAGDDGSPLFAPDGKSLVFTRTETPYYSGEFAKLWRHDLASGKNTPLTEALDYSIDDVQVRRGRQDPLAHGRGQGCRAGLQAERGRHRADAGPQGRAPRPSLERRGRDGRVPQRHHQPAQRALRPRRRAAAPRASSRTSTTKRSRGSTSARSRATGSRARRATTSTAGSSTRRATTRRSATRSCS